MKALSARYPVWLCDIWGVVHNGVAHFPPAAEALRKHRRNGGTVILVTNAPRLHDSVARQLAHLGVPADSYDSIVTSGDVTRHLVTAQGRNGVYHLGPERDRGLFAGLDVQLTDAGTAGFVVCTGLFDDTVETPADYEAALQQFRARELAMICANPDKVVRRGAHLIYCAGAIAERYEQLGGRVYMAGKPYRPIYELALEQASVLRKARVASAQVLAIGDGPETDIAGAAGMNFDVVLVAGGINDAELPLAEAAARVKAQVPSAQIVETVPALAW